MNRILSHSFTFFHPPRVKELGGRKCLIDKEKNNCLSILSLFHPHLHARPPARVCVSTCECRGERMKEFKFMCNSLNTSMLVNPIHSLFVILSPLPAPPGKRYSAGAERRAGGGNAARGWQSLFSQAARFDHNPETRKDTQSS